MKTNISKLLVTILLMGAVYAAAGQPARGSQNDNRGNQKEKKEAFKPEKNNHPRDHIRYKGESRPVPKELNQKDIKYREARRVETARNYHIYTHLLPGLKFRNTSTATNIITIPRNMATP
jgi:hypothetical protein